MEHLALQIIEAAPGSVRRLTTALSPAEVHLRPAEHTWSIVEITGHLVDKTETWGERLRRIAAEDRPFLPGFDQDAYVRDRCYQNQELAPLLQRLATLTVALTLDLRSLPPEAWQRAGVHEERGQMTLGEACRIYAISLPGHIEQLIATRDSAVRTGGG